MRKLIAFDDDTLDKLKQIGRNRMATLQELALGRRPRKAAGETESVQSEGT